MKEFQAIELHHVVRAQNQEVNALAREQLSTTTMNVIALPRFNGAQHLQDVIAYLETSECPIGMEKGQQRWLVRKASRYRLMEWICIVKGRI